MGGYTGCVHCRAFGTEKNTDVSWTLGSKNISILSGAFRLLGKINLSLPKQAQLCLCYQVRPSKGQIQTSPCLMQISSLENGEQSSIFCMALLHSSVQKEMFELSSHYGLNVPLKVPVLETQSPVQCLER